MFRVGLIWLVCVLLSGTLLQAQDAEKKSTKTVSFDDSGEAPAVAVADGLRVQMLGDREARKLGLNLRNVKRALKEWEASPDFDPEASAQKRGYAVAGILAENKQTKATMDDMVKGQSDDAAALNWQAFVDAVMQILAFIQKFFPK